MRVGIKAGSYSPNSGGAIAFQNPILDALSAVSSPHEIVLLQNIEGEQPPPSLLRRAGRRGQRLVQRLTNTQPKPQPESNFEAQTILQQGIDVLWHLCPLARPVPVPYIATVWDLAHRCLPLFPECQHQIFGSGKIGRSEFSRAPPRVWCVDGNECRQERNCQLFRRISRTTCGLYRFR